MCLVPSGNRPGTAGISSKMEDDHEGGGMDEVIKIALEAPRAGTAAIDTDSKPAGGVVAN